MRREERVGHASERRRRVRRGLGRLEPLGGEAAAHVFLHRRAGRVENVLDWLGSRRWEQVHIVVIFDLCGHPSELWSLILLLERAHHTIVALLTGCGAIE